MRAQPSGSAADGMLPAPPSLATRAGSSNADAPPRYASPAAAASNAQAAGAVRALVSVAAAVALGLSGRGGVAGGVVAYLVSHGAASAALLSAAGCAPARYFPGASAGAAGAAAWAASGLPDNAVLFVFAWTLSYTLAHVYRD